MYNNENAVILTLAANPKKSDDLWKITSKSILPIIKGEKINASSKIKKIEITLEIKLNPFLIFERHISEIKKLITIANNWDKTTRDSILLMAKNEDIADHKKRQKNKIDDLLKIYSFFNDLSFIRKTISETVLIVFKYQS